ncbi:MAG: ribonuclease R [Luteitalea sp.]|nr:ribonuclease R [Luteitalea sp.]
MYRDPRLLRDVVSLGGIGKRRQDGPVDGTAVPLDQRGERGGVSVAGAPDQLRIRHGGHTPCRLVDMAPGWKMSSQDQILERIRARVAHPAKVQELMRTLEIPSSQRAVFRRQLEALVSSGALIETRGKHYGLPELMDLVVGRVSVHPQGFAFVTPEHAIEGLVGDLYVAGTHVNEAMHRDRVVARIERHRPDGRAEGRILRILERAATTVVGRFDLDAQGLQFVVPFHRRLLMDIQVPRGEQHRAKPGQMVAVEITRWPTPTRNPLGRVVEVLGDIDAPGVDTTIIIRKWSIPEAHSPDAIAEATRLGTTVARRDVAGRTDFRDLDIVTIDGEHARDFDDAISIEKAPKGHYLLGVHIADVSHYVREGSVLDEEAGDRGTSVYFPERAVHMFPSELATGLCSLNPDVDRLVQSVLMEIDRRGNVVDYSIHDGIIHSRARMTYTAVNAILTEQDEALRTEHATLVPRFELMRELFEILNARRVRRGSIDFDLPEPQVILDAAGMIENILPAARNVAHRIIEEFMLLANETVARHLADHGVPTLFRVHEPPDALKVEEFDEFIATLGYGLSVPPHLVQPKHFQRLVDRIRNKPEERPIAALMLRTMQKARYDTANLGHFGLATEFYTHFTSPIRRYPDLIVHRTLRELRHGRLTPEIATDRADELPDVARHSSEMERRGDEAERELLQWKKVRFMANKVGDEFDGYITGVAPFGLFVELVEHFVEGMVRVSTMADDYYRFVERAHVLRGESTHKVYRLGDHVRVQVVRVDLERRQVDLGLVEILEKLRREGVRGQGSGVRQGSAMRGKGAGGKGRRAAGRSTKRESGQRPGRHERAARKGTGRRRS